jgi:hypothetical protein
VQHQLVKKSSKKVPLSLIKLKARHDFFLVSALYNACTVHDGSMTKGRQTAAENANL